MLRATVMLIKMPEPRKKYHGPLMQVRIEPEIEPEVRRWSVAHGRTLQAEVNRALFLYYANQRVDQPLSK